MESSVHVLNMCKRAQEFPDNSPARRVKFHAREGS